MLRNVNSTISLVTQHLKVETQVQDLTLLSLTLAISLADSATSSVTFLVEAHVEVAATDLCVELMCVL